MISWFLEGECFLSILFVLDTISFMEGEKTIAYLCTHISSLWTWLELDKKSDIRRAIRVSNAQNVFSTLTRDCHTLSICVASTLHHVYLKGRTAIGLCIIPSETNVVPICSSISKSVSHQLSSQWISANKKFHSKTKERHNGSAWRCFAHHLSWQWHPNLGRRLIP